MQKYVMSNLICTDSLYYRIPSERTLQLNDAKRFFGTTELENIRRLPHV